MSKLILSLSAALFLTLSPQAHAASTRPAPRAIGEMASPVTTTRTFNGVTEGEAYLKNLDPKQRAELEAKGQVLVGEQKQVEKSYAGYIHAIAIFKQPKKRVYDLMIESDRQVLYLPRITDAKAVDTPPNGMLVEFKLKVVFSKFIYYTRHWFYPEYSRVEWALDPTYKSDIKLQEGYWQLYEVGPNLTVGEYGTKIDTGVAVPQFIQDFLARKDIPKAMTAFRAYMDSNGTFRRDE